MTHPILVTGAAGFIGARFVESCNRRSEPVISVDRSEFFRERHEHAGLDFGEIIDLEDLPDQIRAGREAPAAIVHLGACTDTREMDEALLDRINLKYSQELWNWSRAADIPFVYASSAATYGGGEQGYEDDESRMSELRPLNPYGQSKLDFDLWALAEEKAGRSPGVWSGFKFFNVYGLGERHKAGMCSVVVQAFDQIRETGKVCLFRSHRDGVADGEQARDFIYVEDVIKVLRFALGEPLTRGIYNLGSGQARTFLDLARAVFAALEVPEKIEFFDTPTELRERYQYFTEASMGKLRGAGYEAPFMSLEEGVSQCVQRLLAMVEGTGGEA
ncbi:MAG: ADP-glyceromanno-heptose 6-epimerase [Planctomycetota bacterium]|jgi:ADP-L-glycero-D-manno-heptose 6-epimerase